MLLRGSLATRMGAVGLAVFVTGGALLGAAAVAGASGSTGCATSCSITATSTTGLDTSSAVQVTGSGFAPKATGAVVECNMAPGQPTVPVPDDAPNFTHLGSLPVGCSSPNQTPAKVSKAGSIFAGPGVTVGTIGPPAVGGDSSGGEAATDAVNYPCPPTQAQVSAGVSCAFVYQDSKGETASIAVSFTTAFSTLPTTTTTAAPPVGCTPAPAQNTGGPPTVTVNPGTCLVGGVKVTVTGSGLKASQLGAVLECNTASGEPQVHNALANQNIPVGCTDPVKNLASTDAGGNLPSTTFTVVTGTVGPPATGTDTAGQDATADAANYPCPPTTAQQAAGVTCAVVYGDQGGDQVVVPVGFGANPGATGNNPGGGATSAASARATTTKAATGQLAFTGAGSGLTILGVLGLLLVILGGSLVLVVDGPGRLWWSMASRWGSRPKDVGR
ncbi:MAG TPA: hypothetical protein VNC61_09205 [Acidimicrobiales bacterium]|nr:hypothetical protein [Acidimicrobiales bacterium]